MDDITLVTPMVEQVEAALDGGDAEEAKRLVALMVADWTRNKDYSINWITSLLSFIGRRLGEDAVEEALRDFGERYLRARRGGGAEPSKMVEYVARAMKANGASVELLEDEEKWALSFRCGSGGKLIDEGAYDAPRNYLRLSGPSALTYGAPEIPVYCAHCPVNNEIQPIEWDGVPASIVYPQTEPGGICTHHIYKDPSLIPASVYERNGTRPPEA